MRNLLVTCLACFAIVFSAITLGLNAASGHFDRQGQARDRFVAAWDEKLQEQTNGVARILPPSSDYWAGYNYYSDGRRILLMVSIGSCTTTGEIHGVGVEPTPNQQQMASSWLLLSAPTSSTTLQQWIDTSAPNFRQQIAASSLGKCVVGNTAWETQNP